MKTSMQPEVSEFFNEAAQTLSAAMQAGIRMQGEATRWWTEMLRDTNSFQTLQRRTQSMVSELVPNTRMNVGQYLYIIDRGYRTSMDLLQRTIMSGKGMPFLNVQQQMQEIWLESLGALRSNACDLVQINTRMMEFWGEMANHGAASGVRAAKSAVAAASGTEIPITQVPRKASPATRTKTSGARSRTHAAPSRRKKQK